MQNETVSRLALRTPVTIGDNATLRDAIVEMRAAKLGCAIVVDKAGKPRGMLTESMLTRILAHIPHAVDDSVVDHMAEQWPWVKLTDPIVDVLEAIQFKNVRFLCVVGEEGRLAGLTGQKGLMEYVADHFPGQVMVQRVGCKPFLSKREGA